MATTGNAPLSTRRATSSEGGTVCVLGERDDTLRRLERGLRSLSVEFKYCDPPDRTPVSRRPSAGVRSFTRMESPNAYRDWTKGVIHALRSPGRLAERPILYVVNLVGLGGGNMASQSNEVARWLEALKALEVAEPATPILATLDPSTQGALITGILAAGVDEIIGTAESSSAPLVLRRVQHLLERFGRDHQAGTEGVSAKRGHQSAGEAVIERQPAPTDAEIGTATRNVEAAVAQMTSVAERAAWRHSLVAIPAPQLRSARGRLDAKKIADHLGVSLSGLAEGLPISRQAVLQTPDSQKIQGALAPMARTIVALESLLPRKDIQPWLQAPHARLRGSTPLQALLGGRAGRVATMLEMLREGDID